MILRTVCRGASWSMTAGSTGSRFGGFRGKIRRRTYPAKRKSMPMPESGWESFGRKTVSRRSIHYACIMVWKNGMARDA